MKRLRKQKGQHNMDNPDTQTTLVVTRNTTMTNKIKKHSTESLNGEQYGGKTFEKTKRATQNRQSRNSKKTNKTQHRKLKK